MELSLKSTLVDKGPYRRAHLKSYISQMSSPDPKGVFDNHVAEVLEQQGYSWDEDPRSIYDPQQLYTALKRYASDWSKFEGMDEHIRYGFKQAFQIFGRPANVEFLSPLDDSQVIHDALKLDKSSGLPMLVHKKNDVYAFDREYQIRLGLKAPNPCIAYKRTQAKNKTRLVWGYPMEMTIMESRFARPLINLFLDYETPMAFGLPKIHLGSKLHRYFEDRPGVTYCLDYSKYDSTVSATMINKAFDILSTWFRPEDREELGWRIIQSYFVCTPIVMPDGHLYVGKRHGVPSGSYFTQMIDSIINVAMMYALKSRFNLKFNASSLLVLGDDIIVQVEGGVQSLTDWAKYLQEWGLVLHDDEKTVVGEVHFLGAFWKKGKPHRELQELINLAVHPEKFRNYQGQPDTGVVEVLRGYASSYIEGWRLIPKYENFMDIFDNSPHFESLLTDYIPGAAKFQEEEFGRLGKMRGLRPSLGMRLML